MDSVITIPNERLLTSIDRTTSLTQAFVLADDVLRQAIQGISDLILVPGLINLDFPDMQTIMAGMGVAVMGTGIGEGENRAVDAARAAISSPLLEDASIEGARGVIINVTGGADMSLLRGERGLVDHSRGRTPRGEHHLRRGRGSAARTGRSKITVIATGFDRAAPGKAVAPSNVETPVDLQNYAAWFKGRDDADRIPMRGGGRAGAACSEVPPASAAAAARGRRGQPRRRHDRFLAGRAGVPPPAAEG